MKKLRVMDKLKQVNPGPRFASQGPGSGEEFRDSHLIQAFDSAVKAGDTLIVDMDGAPFGFPTSFLEESFGGLTRCRGAELVQKHIEIQCADEPLLIREIAHYIEHAEEEKKTFVSN